MFRSRRRSLFFLSFVFCLRSFVLSLSLPPAIVTALQEVRVRIRSIALSLGLAVASMNCGGEKPAAPAPAASTAAPAAAAAPAPAAPAPNLCPLTVAQVSAALGVPVKQVDGCAFFPQDAAKAKPSASYILHVKQACAPAILSLGGYKEKFE